MSPHPPFALAGARIFDGHGFHDRRTVLVEDGRIAAVVAPDAVPKGMASVDLDGLVLAPGFVDVQVNGGGGVLFNDAPTIEGLRAIVAAHRRFGTTGLMPTLISDAPDAMPRAIAAVRTALAAGEPGVLGIHLEGPFFNQSRRGTHAARHIRPLTADDLPVLASLGDAGRTIVTLAPELAPPGSIEALATAGVRVSAGHTDADYATMRAAERRGVTGVTHLFNAMSALTGREPGVVGAALRSRALWCGLIVDAIHVHPASLAIAVAARGPGRMMLVTDAMPPVGADDPSFVLNGERITVRDGRCVNAEGALAGAALDMATAVRNTVRDVGLPLGTALAMASLHPAAFLGLDDRIGRIAPGWRADLVAIDDDLRVVRTWVGGR
jgi:N-acetylglucosamine-6-phosphate deacetylase